MWIMSWTTLPHFENFEAWYVIPSLKKWKKDAYVLQDINCSIYCGCVIKAITFPWGFWNVNPVYY